MAEYIDRDMLLKMISHKPSSPTTEREDRLINGFISAVKNCPAADVRPVVRGRWKLGSYSGKYGSAKEKWYDQFFDGAFWYCDQCRERARKSNFCPNCGADMREES